MTRFYHHLTALSLYTVVAFCYFGIPVMHHFTSAYCAINRDATIYPWCFKWFPYAIRHGISLLNCPYVWAPGGYDLSFTTCIPGLSLLSMPLTQWLGPIATYNVWQILNPALASYFTFAVCHLVTQRFGGALLGGYIYGFSSYQIFHTITHLQQTTNFPIPLMVYLVMALQQSSIKPASFIIGFSASLVFLSLACLEVFATFTMFGSMALLLDWWLAREARGCIRKCLLPLVWSYAVCAILISPYLYSTSRVAPTEPIHGRYVENDLLSPIIPGPENILGGSFRSISSRIGGEGDQGYFGIGLLLIVWLYARKYWREPQCRILTLCFLIPALASLGPVIQVLGWSTVPSPFLPLAYLPLIKHALPCRDALFASLPLGVLVSLWLSRGTTARWWLAMLSILLIVPHLPPAHTFVNYPPFISQGLYKKYIPQDANVAVIPYNGYGNCMLWQQESDFYFRMAGGYIGPLRGASRYNPNPLVRRAMESGAVWPGLAVDLRIFILEHAVQAVVIDATAPPGYRELFDQLGVSPQLVGGVWLYSFGAAELDRLRHEDTAWQHTAYLASYDEAFRAVGEFNQRRLPLNKLSPSLLEEAALLLPQYGVRTNEWTQTGLWIGPWKNHTVAVGILGDTRTALPLIDKYRQIASQIYFPYPKLYNPQGGSTVAGELLMVFDPDRMARPTP